MAGDAFRFATFLTQVQPRLVSVFVQRRGSHPHLDDELTNQIAGFGSLFSSIKQSLQLLHSSFAFDATINHSKYLYCVAETAKNGGQYVISRNYLPIAVSK